MPILQAFEALYNRVYQTGDFDLSYDVLVEYFFPGSPTESKHPTWRELHARFGNKSHETYRFNVNKFKAATQDLLNNPQVVSELATFETELQTAYRIIEELGYFASLNSLSELLHFHRSIIGILPLGLIFGFPDIAHVVSINNQGYLVPKDISQDQLETALRAARKEANFYGSVYPYVRLNCLEIWQIVPSPHRIRFAKELFASNTRHLELGDGEFFGFTDFRKDRLLSRLIQIFSVYEQVPDENLVDSLHRTIKKRVLNDAENNNVDILDECAEIFDEYCLKAGYYLANGNYRSASAKLKDIISNYPPTGEMYDAERNFVIKIRQHGEPMRTKSFVPLVDELKANKSHVMEYAGLFYRKGYKRNSTYHTLDDRYEERVGALKESKPTERCRVEINRIYRNLRWAQRVKRLCQNRCQICGTVIQIGEAEFYSEAHHIQPLGEPHNGPDILENMLCVCPNHHVILDYGGMRLKISELLFTKEHPIAQVFVDYHNHNIFDYELTI